MADEQKWGKPCHVYAVRCPYPDCGKPNDFREVADAITEGEGKNRPTVECDYCHRVIEVVKVEPAVLVWVRQWQGGPTTERKQFAILRCPVCRLEVYPDGGGRYVLNDEMLVAGSRCLTVRNGVRCQGRFQGQVIVDEIGERHQVLQGGRVVFKCPACKAEFYGKGFSVNEVGQHLCSCGEPLVKHAP